MARASQICARVMESSSRLRTARRVRGRRTSSAPRRKRTELADRAAERDKTMTGTIAKVMSDKGFGFIQGEDGQEYFMHRSAVRDGSVFEQLREGQTVVFEAGRGDKGLRAENVRVSRARRIGAQRHARPTLRVGARR